MNMVEAYVTVCIYLCQCTYRLKNPFHTDRFNKAKKNKAQKDLQIAAQQWW